MLLTLLDRIHHITRTTHIVRVLTSGVPHNSSYYPHYSTFLILLKKCLVLLELFTSFVPDVGWMLPQGAPRNSSYNPHYSTSLTLHERTPHNTRTMYNIRVLTSGGVLPQGAPHHSSCYPHYSTLLHITHNTRKNTSYYSNYSHQLCPDIKSTT